MANFEEIREKIDERITFMGLTYRDVSLKIGRKDSYIQQYVKYGFPKRLKEVDRKKVAVVLGIDEKELVDDELMVDVLDGELVYKDEVSGKICDFSNVGIYNKLNEESGGKLIGKLMLDKRVFSEFFDEKANLKIILQDGDAMADVILDEALVVYDEVIKKFIGDGVYVIKYKGNVLVRRLQIIGDGSFLMISDNRCYENWEIKKEEFEILGKVRMVYNGVRL